MITQDELKKLLATNEIVVLSDRDKYIFDADSMFAVQNFVKDLAKQLGAPVVVAEMHFKTGKKK